MVSSTKESITLYTQQIDKTTRISAEEEITLSNDIIQGKIAQKILTEVQDALKELNSQTPNPSSFEAFQVKNKHKELKQQQKELSKTIQQGFDARQRFLTANLKLVVYYAKAYQKKSHLPLGDLIQEGNIGLIRALDKFDPSKGFRFSTYATWWIRQSLGRATQRDTSIRIPNHQLERKHQVNFAQKYLSASYEKPLPSAQELSDYLGMDLEFVQQVLSLPETTTSLDAPAPTQTENEATLLIDVIPETKVKNPEDSLYTNETHLLLNQAITELLPPREQLIFKLRFGLDGEEEKSLEAIGAEIGLTRERVRQLIQIWSKRLKLALQNDLHRED